MGSSYIMVDPSKPPSKPEKPGMITLTQLDEFRDNTDSNKRSGMGGNTDNFLMLGLVATIIVLTVIFGGEPDLMDGILYWMTDGAWSAPFQTGAEQVAP